MTAVLATDLKKNFKVYAGKASDGEIIKIRRPQKEDDLILMSEREYNQYKRLLAYFARVNGYNDLLIAATVISKGGILVTNNEKEFSRIPGVRIENWTK